MRTKKPVLFYLDSRDSKDNYSRELIVRGCPCGHTKSIVGDKDHWVANITPYTLCVCGPRIFWKPGLTTRCTFKDGKLYGNIQAFKGDLCKTFHLDWITTNPWTLEILQERKDLWTQVFKGKITNPEQLCKFFSKKYFKGAYSYKSLRIMAQSKRYAPLWDIYYHTTNPEEALKVYLQHDYNELFNDVLTYSKILNTRMNPKWSKKRFQVEHQRQIELVNYAKIASFSDENIAKEVSIDGLSLVLNERECYLEGCTMHNCVHSCYWKRIVAGEYLLAKGEVNGEYINYGIRTGGDNLSVDQMHTIYNGIVSEETRNFCVDWMLKHKEQLIATSKEIKEKSEKLKSWSFVRQDAYQVNDIIPF